MRRSLVATLTATLAVALLAAAPPRPALASPSLPLDHLHFGLASAPGDLSWMTGTGGWTYRYQYLAGGVNTSGDWQTWQDPSMPPGQFVLDYSNASRGAGIVPVFTYYELLQSTPSIGANESDRDWSNLHNASTMHAYYADFAVLMQRLGQYGGPVIVHVEPDLWGYLQARAAGNPASALSATVGSSGAPDVAGIPDTVTGFGDALLHIRDLYAPNAAMALHASMWGSGVDVASDTRASVDGGAIGRATGTFLSSAGIASNPFGSTWDLVFHDVDDHDAGWWEAQGADNAGFTHWWDASNSRFPDFTRWLQWVGGLRAATGVPQVAWQVPIGNQHYLAMNNTCGHYQDNVAEYVLAHPDQLAGAGVSAVLFGAGNSCQTTNLDAEKDGVTNNNGQPTTDAAGGCNACNTATSTVADDDGGFLRTAVPAYERAGAVPIASAPSSAPPPPFLAGVRGNDGQLWVTTGAGRGFNPLGGVLTGAPAIAWVPAGSGGGSYLYVVTGTDHQLYARTDASAWRRLTAAPTYCVDNPAVVVSGIVATVACMGSDAGLYAATGSVSPGGVPSLGAFSGLGGVLTAGPTVAVVGGQVTFFVTGSDQHVYVRQWGTAFTRSPWSCKGHPAVGSSGTMAWFGCHGTDDQLWYASDGGSGWSGALPAGGVLVDGPGVAPVTGQATFFVEGTDQALYELTVSPGAPVSGWTRDGGVVRSGAGAA